MDNFLQSLLPELSIEKMREFVLSEVTETAKPVNYIITAARGAPRAMEWLFRNLHTLPVPVVSERAIPFITGELKKSNVCLFDDSIIYGSTLYDIKQQLLKQNAQVKISTLVTDEYWFEGKGKSPWSDKSAIPSKFKSVLQPFKEYCSLPTQLMPPYHRLLLQSFRDLGKPYAVDFPILKTQLSDSVSDWSESEWELHFRSATGIDAFCLTPKGNKTQVIQAFSLPANTETLIEPLFAQADGIELEKHSKFRFHISSEKFVAILTPMLIFRISKDNYRIKFKDSLLNECWNCLRSTLEINSVDEPEKNVAIFRALTFVASLGAGLITWPLIFRGLTKSEDTKLELSYDDTALLFGHNLANILVCNFNETLKGLVDDKNYYEKDSLKQTFISTMKLLEEKETQVKFDNDILKSDLEKWIDTREHPTDWQINPEMTVMENLQKIFLVLRDMADESKRPNAEDAKRLKEGFSTGDLRGLLEEAGVNSTFEELSFCIDFLVDIGAIVPMIALSGNKVIKVYRSGERCDADQFASALHRCMREWQEEAGERWLTDTAFTKICVLLERLYPDSVPLYPGQHLHGASLFDKNKDIVRWALRHKVLIRP